MIGPTGFFLIEAKNLDGYYFINNNDWLHGTGKIKAHPGNPPRQFKTKTIEFNKFLAFHQVNVEYGWVDIYFEKNNYTIEKRPKNYEVMHPENMVSFIINHKKKIDEHIIKNSVAIIEPYCSAVYR